MPTTNPNKGAAGIVRAIPTTPYSNLDNRTQPRPSPRKGCGDIPLDLPVCGFFICNTHNTRGVTPRTVSPIVNSSSPFEVETKPVVGKEGQAIVYEVFRDPFQLDECCGRCGTLCATVEKTHYHFQLNNLTLKPLEPAEEGLDPASGGACSVPNTCEEGRSTPDDDRSPEK